MKREVGWIAGKKERLEKKSEKRDKLSEAKLRKRLSTHLGQARKSKGRMPWHQKPKKDVASCEKLRVGAHI